MIETYNMEMGMIRNLPTSQLQQHFILQTTGFIWCISATIRIVMQLH